MTYARIYADFNGLAGSSIDGSLFVPLDTEGSLRDLTNAGIRLQTGLTLSIYDCSDDEEDLEAEAITRYDYERARWLAVIGESGYRYVKSVERTSDPRFLCLECRADVAIVVRSLTAHYSDSRSCPHCGTSLSAALAPPDRES